MDQVPNKSDKKFEFRIKMDVYIIWESDWSFWLLLQ